MDIAYLTGGCDLLRLLLAFLFLILLIAFRKKVSENISHISISNWDILLLCGYILGMLFVTIGIRTYDNEHTINLHPIRTYQLVFGTIIEGIQKNAFLERFSWVQAALEGYALNILLFVPFGFLMPYVVRPCNWQQIVMYGCVFSLLIEITQLITRLGWFDTTDIIHNTIGSFLGYKLYIIIERR